MVTCIWKFCDLFRCSICVNFFCRKTTHSFTKLFHHTKKKHIKGNNFLSVEKTHLRKQIARTQQELTYAELNRNRSRPKMEWLVSEYRLAPTNNGDKQFFNEYFLRNQKNGNNKMFRNLLRRAIQHINEEKIHNSKTGYCTKNNSPSRKKMNDIFIKWATIIKQFPICHYFKAWFTT